MKDVPKTVAKAAMKILANKRFLDFTKIQDRNNRH